MRGLPGLAEYRWTLGDTAYSFSCIYMKSGTFLPTPWANESCSNRSRVLQTLDMLMKISQTRSMSGCERAIECSGLSSIYCKVNSSFRWTYCMSSSFDAPSRPGLFRQPEAIICRIFIWKFPGLLQGTINEWKSSDSVFVLTPIWPIFVQISKDIDCGSNWEDLDNYFPKFTFKSAPEDAKGVIRKQFSDH